MKYYFRRNYSKSSPSTPFQGSSTSRRQFSLSAPAYTICVCVKVASKTLFKFSNHHAFKLSNLFGFQRFQTLVCTEPQQIGKQEVNDSDTQIDWPKRVQEEWSVVAKTVHLIEDTKLSLCILACCCVTIKYLTLGTFFQIFFSCPPYIIIGWIYWILVPRV